MVVAVGQGEIKTPTAIFPWHSGLLALGHLHLLLDLFVVLVVLSFLRTHTMSARPHKQSMSELKLRRLTEHNQRLREDLARPRMRVSEASARYISFPPFSLLTAHHTPNSLIRYCKTTKDHLVRRAAYLSSTHRLNASKGSICLGSCREGRGSICTTTNRLQLRCDVMRCFPIPSPLCHTPLSPFRGCSLPPDARCAFISEHLYIETFTFVIILPYALHLPQPPKYRTMFLVCCMY